MLQSKEKMYQISIENARKEFTKKQILVAEENEAFNKRITDLSAQVIKLSRDKDKIGEFVSQKIKDIAGGFVVMDEFKSEVEIEEDGKAGRFALDCICF